MAKAEDVLQVGKALCYTHGNQFRMVTVTEMDEHRVRLSGVTANYWIKKKTLLRILSVDE